MNKYSLAADSPRWWWPSATAGVIGAAALGAILVLPAAGHTVPVNNAPDEPATTVVSDDGNRREHWCFMRRPNWNDAVGGPQPVCYYDADTSPATIDSLVRHGLPVSP